MDKIADAIMQDARAIAHRVDLTPLLNRTVLVTGATGLIGTYVMAVLKAYGGCRSVYPVATRAPSIASAAGVVCRGYRFIESDLSQYSFTYPAQFDYGFFGAGYGQPKKFTDAPLRTLALNTTGLMSILEGMNQGGRLLFASTSEIYSGHTKPPFSEHEVGTTSPQHPRGCYIEAKRCGEAICSAYNLENRRDKALAARIALAYGPGTRPDDDRAINQFIRQAILDRKIVLKDAGQVIRNYCYIADTIELLFNIWLHGRYEVYNVGGKSKVTIAALARKIGELCDVPVEVPGHTENIAAPDNVTLDMRQAEAEFLKSDYTPLEDGLRRTISWQKILYGKV